MTALPIGLTLEGDATHTVAPLPDGAVSAIADGSRRRRRPRTGSRGTSWSPAAADGKVLRVISPQNLMAPYFDRPDRDAVPGRLWTATIDQVWEKYRADRSADRPPGRAGHPHRPGQRRHADLRRAATPSPSRPRRTSSPATTARSRTTRVTPTTRRRCWPGSPRASTASITAHPPRSSRTAPRRRTTTRATVTNHWSRVRARQLADRLRLPVRRRTPGRPAGRLRRGARRQPAALHGDGGRVGPDQAAGRSGGGAVTPRRVVPAWSAGRHRTARRSARPSSCSRPGPRRPRSSSRAISRPISSMS